MGWSSNSNKTVQERLEWLEDQHRQLLSALRTVRTDLDAERTARTAADGELRERLERVGPQIRTSLRAEQRKQDRVDARALFPLFNGLLVTTFAAELASVPDFGAAVLMSQIWVLGYALVVLIGYPDEQDHFDRQAASSEPAA